MEEGPCGPRVGREPVLILPAENNWRTKVTRSRKQGSGDKPPMSTAAGNVLIEGGPRRFFGDFLIVQKVTSPLPTPQGGIIFTAP